MRSCRTVRRASKVGAAGVGGFLITFGAIVLYWLPSFGESCSGEECTLEYAAIMTWGIIIGLLVGASCAFVAYILTGAPKEPS